MQTLSIIIPAYNEAKTIREILQKIVEIELMNTIQKEIIVVNDGSRDNTDQIIIEFISENALQNIRYFKHEVNLGKGAALHTGIRNAKGDFMIVQDADMEYDPQEYNKMLKPIVDGFADVVYGSRFMGGNPHRVLYYWHSIGNFWLTNLSNIFTNLNLTDMETCYKMVRGDLLKSLVLKERRFGFEPEVTAKLSRIKGIRIYEVGISYYGRTYIDGKKISWKDGLKAIYCILKYNIIAR